MSETFGYKLGKFIKNNFSSSTQKVVSAGVDSLEKRLNKPVKKSSSDDDYQNKKSGSSNFVGMDMGSGMRVDLGGIYDKKGHLIADKFDDE